MARVKSTSCCQPGAWIVSPKDKGRKSIKNGKVFLENKSEFEIELFNPLTDCVLADIKLNGQSISKTGLVVKPGQRVYLDCFIDDGKKFVFNTYEVENTSESIEATAKNGLLEVFFYKEDVVTINNWQRKFDRVIVEKYYPTWYPDWSWYPWGPNRIYYGTNTITIADTNLTFGSTSTTTTANYNSGDVTFTTNGIVGCCNTSSSFDLGDLTFGDVQSINCSANIETGRVEKGNASSQKFTEIDMDFEQHYIASTIIQLLPESRKPAEVKKVKGSLTKVKAKDILKRESDEVIGLIKKLAELHESGILTDEEFSNKKAELLSQL